MRASRLWALDVKGASLLCVLLLAACGGTKTQGKPPDTSLTSFCSELSSLNLAVANMRALDPRTVASDHTEVFASYTAVQRQTPGVHGVKLSPLTAAYKDYSQAVVVLNNLPVI